VPFHLHPKMGIGVPKTGIIFISEIIHVELGVSDPFRKEYVSQ